MGVVKVLGRGLTGRLGKICWCPKGFPCGWDLNCLLARLASRVGKLAKLK